MKIKGGSKEGRPESNWAGEEKKELKFKKMKRSADLGYFSMKAKYDVLDVQDIQCFEILN